MSVLITSRKPKLPIVYARVGVVIAGKRYLHVCRQDADGVQYDEWSQLPWNDHDMSVVPNLGGDLDDAYLKDIVESIEGRKAARRVERPNITTLYHEMNEQRALELKGRSLFSMSKKEEPS